MASLTPLSGKLGHRQASHLLRRASYRFNKAKVDELANKTAATAVSSLLTQNPLTLDQPLYGGTVLNPLNPPVAWINPALDPLPAQDFILRRWIQTWWLGEALNDAGAAHKMTFFLHQYMVVTANTSANQHFFDYLALLRWASLGNFKKLAYKIILDNCMLRYLNNATNTANNPNENFAREFFELFTIGKGPQIGPGDYTNYTEVDIVEAAKVFTGVRNKLDRTIIDPETNIPSGILQAGAHNWNAKTFSSKFQNTAIPAVTVNNQKTAAKMVEELNILVNMVFAQPETARNFCRRLYRFFVSENISAEIESDIIEPLAKTFRDGDYEIKPVLQQLLQSEHFFDADDSDNTDEIIGGIIKPPLDNTLQSIAFFNMPLPDAKTQAAMRYQFFSVGVIDRMLNLAGMNIFQPSDVAGYPGFYQSPDFSHQWFNSSTIIARYKLPAQLLSGKAVLGGNQNLFAKIDIAPWVKNSGFFSDPSDPYVLVQELLKYMLPLEVDNDRFNYFYQTVFLDNLPPADWTYEWQNYLNSNSDTEVKLALERLVNAIMFSQEYQTF